MSSDTKWSYYCFFLLVFLLTKYINLCKYIPSVTDCLPVHPLPLHYYEDLFKKKMLDTVQESQETKVNMIIKRHSKKK